MKYVDNKVEGVKIAYIGGGSRGWAWGLMSDLVSCDDMSGDVYLYDIDQEASKANEIIGNKFNSAEGAKTVWNYHAVENIGDALTGADFVVISILPGTFDEMEVDVHAPEKYGIYQPVGDSTGPGGIVRAMRTVPMFEEIAENIKKYSPEAWVINYTNPMTLCVKTLYRVFPEIKAYGCCHEVFDTQTILAKLVGEHLGEENVDKFDIMVNPLAINHFTWLTKAKYKNVDIMPLYKEVCKNSQAGYDKGNEENWFNKNFATAQRVKMDLCNKFGYIAAAGDRHLSEFCEGKWYLASPERVEEMKFALTPVSWRKEDLKQRLEKSEKLLSGELQPEIKKTGEQGVVQMRALLGLSVLVTNVNIPNRGQIPNLPLGAVVETNAVFSAGDITPVLAGNVPTEIYPLVSRICYEQENLNNAIAERDVKKIFNIFMNDPLVTCTEKDGKELFKDMTNRTKKYLTMYDLTLED